MNVYSCIATNPSSPKLAVVGHVWFCLVLASREDQELKCKINICDDSSLMLIYNDTYWIYYVYIYIYLLYINIYIYIIYKYIYIYRLYNIIYTVGSFLKLGYPQIMEFNRIYTIFWYWKPWWRLGIQNGLPSHGREAKRGSGQPFDPPELASVSLEISLECSGILFFFKSCSCHVLHSKKKYGVSIVDDFNIFQTKISVFFWCDFWDPECFSRDHKGVVLKVFSPRIRFCKSLSTSFNF